MTECNREQEVVRFIVSGRWPEGCSEELWNHVQVCLVCREAIALARELQTERASALETALAPAAGLVWWRAELRARQDASRAAERSLNVVNAFGAACAIGVAV